MANFVPCTAADSTCVNQKYPFGGVSGVCDNVTGLCQCPDGFTGVDLLTVWNDCHISEMSRTAVESIALAANIVTIGMALFGIFRLLNSWGAKPVIVKGLVTVQFPKSQGEVSYQRLLMEKRKRIIFMLIFLNILSACFIGLSFQIMVLANPNFAVLQRPNGLGLFLISIQIGAIVLAMYMVLYAWFDALPSFRLFSRMFPQLRSFLLVRYPSFIFISVVINTGLTCSLSFGVFFIFSLVRPELITTQIVPWGMTLFGIEIIIFMCFLASVCVLLLRLLNVFSAESSGRTSPGRPSMLSPEAKKRFIEAKHTIWAMLIITVTCAPIAVTLCMVMAWNDYALANFFFFVALLQSAGAAVGLFMVYVFVFRMHYATKSAMEKTALLSASPGIEGGFSAEGSLSMDVNSPYNKVSFIGQERQSSFS